MWFVLNFIPSPGQRRSSLPTLVEAFNRPLPESERIEVFAPTFISLDDDHGKITRVEKPLLFHYIFIHGDEEIIKRFCHAFNGLSFVMDRASARRHLAVSNQALENFRTIARFHSGKLPCFPLEGSNLEEGDKVQIVSGPCSGLTGTYISRRGGKSGNILVSIDGNMAAIVYDVKADYVRVLEFARNSKRAYDQIDAFVGRLEKFLTDGKAAGGANSSGNLSGDITMISAASSFTTRLGAVKLNNPKLDAKLQILLYAAYRILGDKDQAAEALSRFRTLERHVTNPKTLALIKLISPPQSPREGEV